MLIFKQFECLNWLLQRYFIKNATKITLIHNYSQYILLYKRLNMRLKA